MTKRRAKEEQELADRERLLRGWRAWHKEKLQSALRGTHRDVFERLMAQLKDLHSARELVDAISREDWGAVSADERLEALHQINLAICALRERMNPKEPINDALWGQPPNAFQIIKALFDSFSLRAGRPAEAVSVNQCKETRHA